MHCHQTTAPTLIWDGAAGAKRPRLIHPRLGPLLPSARHFPEANAPPELPDFGSNAPLGVVNALAQKRPGLGH
eukprot:1220091-Lingulodinium_polyedra.AAC.1